MTSKTDGRSITATLSYDNLNRLYQKTYNDNSGPNPTPWVTYSYSGNTDFETQSSWWLSGSSNAIYSWSNYDALGRPGAATQTTNSVSYPFTNLSWTPQGQTASMTYPSGRTVTTSYDGAGRAAGVAGSLAGANTNYASSVLYAPQGAVSAMTTGDGVARVFGYNPRLQMASASAAQGQTTLMSLGYTYSATQNNGNLLGATIAMPGFSAIQSFGYDGANRLTAAGECPAGGCGYNWGQTYVYDARGNRAVYNSPVITSNYTPQTNSQSSVPFDGNNHWAGAVYDAAGNMTGASTQTYVYDGEERLIQQSDSTPPASSVSFGYDADGRRVTKTSGGATTVYVYDPAGNLVAEYGGSQQTGTMYVTRDSLGSTRLVTNAGGSVVGCHDYLPFGEEIPTSWGGRPGCYGQTDTDVKFTGKERDVETGLDNFGARYMSSAQGRWMSADIPLADQDPRDPQSWNLYGYVRNRPLSFVDLDGRKCTSSGIDDQTQDACFTVTAHDSLFGRIFSAVGSFLAGAGTEVTANTFIGTTNTIDSMRQSIYGGPSFQQPRIQPTTTSGQYGQMAGIVLPLFVPGAGEANALDEIGEFSSLLESKALASNLQMQEVLSGSGTPIVGAGAGTLATLREASRLVETYGGQAGDWAKVASSNYLAAGAAGGFEKAGFSGSFEIHAYENVKTGQIVELKTKFQ